MTELGTAVDEVIDENREDFEAYQDGEDGAINFLVGQVMEKTGGSHNPRDVHQLIMTKANGEYTDD